MTAEAVEAIAAEMTPDGPADIQAWVSAMFARCDANGDKTISFLEFEAFIRSEAKLEAEKRRTVLRNRVAANMEAHDGALDVTKQEGGETRNIHIAVAGVEPKDIRK